MAYMVPEIYMLVILVVGFHSTVFVKKYNVIADLRSCIRKEVAATPMPVIRRVINGKAWIPMYLCTITYTKMAELCTCFGYL